MSTADSPGSGKTPEQQTSLGDSTEASAPLGRRSGESIEWDANNGMIRLVPATRERDYRVSLVPNLLGAQREFLKEMVGSRRALIVTTPTVAKLYGDQVLEAIRGADSDASMLVLDCSEESKSLDWVSRICRQAADLHLDRNAVLVGLGGGVCTDLTTIAASMIRRGVDYVRVPTTLVGQVDAAIGIKGAVNFAGHKSFLGCFSPPAEVVVDPVFLRSLSRRHLRCGFAEMIKLGIACDERLFSMIERYRGEFVPQRLGLPSSEVCRVIWRSISRMLDQLEPNLYEDRSSARLMDLGHSFSPALEAASDYSIHHGEVVAIDIAFSAVLAERIGMLDRVASGRILSLFREIGLPVWHPLMTPELCRASLEEAARHRRGDVNLVLPTAIGEAEILRSADEIPQHEFDAVLRTLEEIAGN